MSNIILDTKNVGKIKGLFYLSDYQRGYRWTSEEIKLLLDDIYESAGKPYCLQPIVVKKSNERFELIDGQQRLTTIYLICKYMEAKLGDLYEPSFATDGQCPQRSGCLHALITELPMKTSQYASNIITAIDPRYVASLHGKGGCTFSGHHSYLSSKLSYMGRNSGQRARKTDAISACSAGEISLLPLRLAK